MILQFTSLFFLYKCVCVWWVCILERRERERDFVSAGSHAHDSQDKAMYEPVFWISI